MACFLSLGVSYTWNEQLTMIKNSIFSGNNGYPCRYVSYSHAGFDDNMMTYLLLLLELGRSRVNGLDLLCALTQKMINQTISFPRLQVPPGYFIAIKYLKNRHVTLPTI
jgi:hypothetical protein